MKISLNSIKTFDQTYHSAGDPAPNGIDALVQKIGAQLGAIETVSEIGSKYSDALIVRVVSCTNHPDAERLHVCLIDDGKKRLDVARNEAGYVQVVCGAPNVRDGMFAVWLPPGSTVPSSVGKEPFVLEARTIRGQISVGMLASPRELAIGDLHEGILEVDQPVDPGTLFADAYHLSGDYVLDIENKMFTHRPDCFGLMGVAREIAGIQQERFTSPEWYELQPELPDVESEQLPLDVRNELPELVPRFCAITMRDVIVQASPAWLQIELSKVGMRPINNIVDLTNYYMVLTGQPLHAYDYDKVRSLDPGAENASLIVRYPKPGEQVTLLNGKTVTPRNEAIMIATEQHLIGIGGVMGGGDTEVDTSTKNIIIECATFDMYAIRRTSMSHGLFTDAVSRFNKGQSPLQNMAVLARIVTAIQEIGQGLIALPVIDDIHLPQEMLTRGSVHPPVEVSAAFINERLGLSLSIEEIAGLLRNVEFTITQRDSKVTVAAPFWRTDIVDPEDVVEEVGRLYGYDRLPLDLPIRQLVPAPKDKLLELKAALRARLSQMGANEVVTYSFVHGNLLDNAGQVRDQAYQLANALSPDLQYFRLSLTPSLLDKVHMNVKNGFQSFSLFELGKAHNKTELDYENVPREVHALSLVIAFDAKSSRQLTGSPYYVAKTYVDSLLRHFNAADVVRFEPLSGADIGGNPWILQMCAPYEPKHSAVLRDQTGLIWGVVGEYRPSVKKALKLPDYCAGFELDPLLFLQRPYTERTYERLSRYPKVEQDICLKIAATISYERIYDDVHAAVEQLLPEHSKVALSPVDIYQRSDDPEHKQVTLRITVTNFDRTLTDKEISSLLDTVASMLHDSLEAVRV